MGSGARTGSPREGRALRPTVAGCSIDPGPATPQIRMIESAIRSLESSTTSIIGLVRDLTPDERDWRPKPEAWSIHQIVCHLLDEEREDFRQRLRLVLEDPSLEWPPIDPQGWPAHRAYDSRDFAETLAAWEAERAESLAWLRSLDPAAVTLDNAHRMPWGNSAPATSSPPGWPTTCCTCGRSSPAGSRVWKSAPRRSRRAMRGSGDQVESPQGKGTRPIPRG